MNKKLNKINVIYIIFTILSIFAIYKKMFFGIEPDEQYFIAMLYKLENSKYLLKDFYEPHQFSILFPYLLFKIKNLFILGYDILYSRFIGLIFAIIISIYWYKLLEDKEQQRYLISLFVLLFTPKFSYTFDYAMQTYIFVNLLFIFMLSNNKNKDILIGIFSTLLIFAYPPMGLSILFSLILYYKKYGILQFLKGLGSSFCTALILLDFANFQIDFQYIFNIISDPAHALSLFERLQIQVYTESFFIFLLFICFLIIFFKMKKTKQLKKQYKEYFLIISIIFVSFFSLYQIFIEQQQLNYEIKWLIIAMLLYLFYERKANTYNYLIFISISMIIISFFSSNQGRLMFLRYGISFIIIFLYINNKHHLRELILSYCIIFLILSYSFISTNSFYQTNDKNIIQTNYTPLQGIYINQNTNVSFQEFYLNYSSYNGTLCLVGNNVCLNLNSNLKLHQPSCISTFTFDKKTVDYFKKTSYPDFIYCENNFQNGIVSKDFYDFIIYNYIPIKSSNTGILYKQIVNKGEL